jgi:tripartite-type tricarboxylate transporter receptor subunit TctC
VPGLADSVRPSASLVRRLLLATAVSAPFISRALAYPVRPLRVIVPGAAGGAVDMAARAIGEAMQRELGQPWIVEPRPGANGVVAARAFLDANADDHTLYLTVLSHVLLPMLVKVPFDVVADFQPLAMIGSGSFMLCVPVRSPAKTVAGYAAYARANPGRLNYLNPGIGTAPHLLPEMLKRRYELDVMSVYYKSISAGIADLVSGDLSLGLLPTGLALPYLQANLLQAIAQVSRRRIDALPGVATLAEQGLDDTTVEMLLPLYSRTSVDAGKVSQINRAVAAAVADPAVRMRMAAAHIEPLPMLPGEVRERLLREQNRLSALIRQLEIVPEGHAESAHP